MGNGVRQNRRLRRVRRVGCLESSAATAAIPPVASVVSRGRTILEVNKHKNRISNERWAGRGGWQVYIEIYGRVKDPFTLPATVSISSISGNPSLL